jgi:hypothetical protein
VIVIGRLGAIILTWLKNILDKRRLHQHFSSHFTPRIVDQKIDCVSAHKVWCDEKFILKGINSKLNLKPVKVKLLLLLFQNILAGSLFGIWLGFPLCCLLTAVGATNCFLLSKFFGKQYVMCYFADRIESIRQKVRTTLAICSLVSLGDKIWLRR